MRNRLVKLNSEFKEIKKTKKESKKMSETIINQCKYFFSLKAYMKKNTKFR